MSQLNNHFQFLLVVYCRKKVIWCIFPKYWFLLCFQELSCCPDLLAHLVSIFCIFQPSLSFLCSNFDDLVVFADVFSHCIRVWTSRSLLFLSSFLLIIHFCFASLVLYLSLVWIAFVTISVQDIIWIPVFISSLISVFISSVFPMLLFLLLLACLCLLKRFLQRPSKGHG